MGKGVSETIVAIVSIITAMIVMYGLLAKYIDARFVNKKVIEKIRQDLEVMGEDIEKLKEGTGKIEKLERDREDLVKFLLTKQFN